MEVGLFIMRNITEAVIIGGGALGASIFYYLTKLGMKDVVLIEKGELGSGSTGDSAAFIRQHYSNDVSIRLVKKSLEFFQGFSNEFSGNSVFVNTGWFFLVPHDAADVFDSNMIRLKNEGIKTWTISLSDLTDELPGINTDGIGRVAFEPESGYVDPHAMVNAVVNQGVINGGEFMINNPVIGIDTSGKTSVVKTPAGDIETRIVINAAGPWAHQIGLWMDIDLPLEISREQDIVVRPNEGATVITRCVSNMVDRTYIRAEPDGLVLVGTGHPKENETANPDLYKKEADQEFVAETSRLLAHRFPSLSGSEVVKSWAGLYTITPDWNMILDRSPVNDNHYFAVGGSGHSFKIAPAMGQCLAEMIVFGEANTVDISDLNARRFDTGRIVESTYGGNRN